jgi:hypothetical protein
MDNVDDECYMNALFYSNACHEAAYLWIADVPAVEV